jgi:P-type Cu+ transporter
LCVYTVALIFDKMEQPIKSTETPRPASELIVTGMSCSNCVRHVTEALQRVPGVHTVKVSLDTQRASIKWDACAQTDIQALVKSVQSAGYGAKAADLRAASGGEVEPDGTMLAGWKLNVIAGLVCTMPLMLGEWALHLGAERWFRWLSFVLASIVLFLCGARFYRGAWTQLKAGSSNMDTLVALGSTTAFAYSTGALFAGWSGHLYFMEAAAIITLISVGHWLESRMSERAASSLKALLSLTPPRARRLSRDRIEMEVPVDELSVNDLVVLKPGDRAPTDGEVVEGESAVDEAMLTGESVPVDKTAKAKLYAGTVNLSGRLVMRVEATGEATALAQVIAAVERAQTSRANIQRIGDRVSSVFVPVVVLIALATALWWGLATAQATRVTNALSGFLWTSHPPDSPLAAAIVHAAAVLIIACPCAMGLATPVAIMAGTNVAARRGILIRDGVALEKAGQISSVIFDKTGTLTQGKPSVAKIESINETFTTSELMRIASALGQHSNHPLSQAVAKLHDGRAVVTAAWREIHGAGVEGRLGNHSAGDSEANLFRLGSLSWLREAGVDLSRGSRFADEWSAQGATTLGVARNGTLVGMIALRDALKPGAANVVAQLASAGHRIYLVTGDHQRTAAAIARQTGVTPDHVFAEVRPEQKSEIVRRLQDRGERVAFVGDGINDAPALEQADLGIAVSRASDIAREAADIILLNSEIEAVPESLSLARATLRTIKQNLFWAFVYNAFGVPLAALGFLSPVLCAVAMGVSDLIVIGNALRLRHRGMPTQSHLG